MTTRLDSLVLGAFVTSVLILAAIIAPVSASVSSQPQSVPSNAIVALGAKWWQWAFSFPSDESPLSDETGSRCGKGNQGPVFFLAGIAGPVTDLSNVERTCPDPIKRTQLILIPVLNGACLLTTPCSESEPPASIKEMQKQLKSLLDGVVRAEVIVDDKKVKVSRVQTPVFKTTVVEGNPFDNPPGATPAGKFIATADGFWALLKPLPVGPHDIHISGAVPGFTVDVIYHITVK